MAEPLERELRVIANRLDEISSALFLMLSEEQRESFWENVAHPFPAAESYRRV